MTESTPESRRMALENILGRPIIKTLQDNGITPELLAKELNEELRAEKTEFFAHQGEVKETRQVVDWSTRQKARQDAHRLMGHYPPEKTGDSYLSLVLQHNSLILSPVVQKILERHTKQLASFIKKDDEAIDVEVQDAV